jgi:uncharacterized heparinase superfamily protein
LNSKFEQDDLKFLIKEKAKKMMQWLKTITFSNGDIPMVNDAAQNVYPSTEELFSYYEKLSLPEITDIPLKDSGYRLYKYPKYELFTDFGQIGPDYQPGHAHADTFSFLLYIEGKPVIVDTGTSTYESGDRRNFERSTSAHNTLVVNSMNSSDIWASFRVGNRAKVFNLYETDNKIEGCHDGYKRIGLIHHRSFNVSENQIVINDKIISKSSYNAVAFLHFHPQVTLEIRENKVIGKNFLIQITGTEDIRIQKYLFAEGFNLTTPAQKLALFFTEKIETRIQIF